MSLNLTISYTFQILYDLKTKFLYHKQPNTQFNNEYV